MMKRMLFLLSALTILTPLLLFAPASYSFGCARRGDTMSMVLANCGEPTWVDTRREWRSRVVPAGTIIDGWYVTKVPRTIRVQVEIEQWTYDLGRSKFVRFLAFENGILISITTGGYGH
jgi:hypothetical protein